MSVSANGVVAFIRSASRFTPGLAATTAGGLVMLTHAASAGAASDIADADVDLNGSSLE
jgi:hypothetical protein